MSDGIKVGNAPVSYGAFERTVGIDDDVPAARFVLDAVATAGYRGIDLGPLGYLGDTATLPGDLAQRNLMLTGAYLEVDVTSEAGRSRGIAELAAMLDLFDTLGDTEPSYRARPTVAIVSGEASDALVPVADRETWQGAMDVLRDLVSRSRDRGYEPCLHNEVGTLVASGEQIEAAAQDTGMSLCLDTGHLLAAGGDPVDVLERLSGAIRHVHVKDVTEAGIETMRAPEAVSSDVWAKSVFCPLGAGVGRIAEIVARLVSTEYAGWLVVEQDVFPRGPEGYERAAADQVTSRHLLASLGL